jgi:UDP-2,3-diacylglucosamine hydrolase
MSTLFISDLHLAPERPKVTRAFFTFLNQRAEQADALYILGDLFEAWIGDDDPSELAQQVSDKLRKLSNTGVAIYFVHGNRDFMIGTKFAKRSGCKLLPEHCAIDLYGKKVLLLHGDTLCLDDEAYQKFRRKIRSPIGLWLMRHLPLKKRQQIARDWRAKSKMANSNKADNIMDVSTAEVERLLAKFDTKIMIHGHTHRPARHKCKNGERLVLGDWDDLGWVIEATTDSLELSSFDIK